MSIDSSKRKTERITLNLTPWEKQQVEARARALGYTVGRYIVVKLNLGGKDKRRTAASISWDRVAKARERLAKSTHEGETPPSG